MDRRGELPLQVFIILLYYFLHRSLKLPWQTRNHIYTQQSQESVHEFTFYTQSQKHGIKVQTKKGKLYIYFHFLSGAGGGSGVGGSRVVEAVGMGESAFHGPQMFNEDRYVVSLSRSILIEYAIQPWLVSL